MTLVQTLGKDCGVKRDRWGGSLKITVLEALRTGCRGAPSFKTSTPSISVIIFAASASIFCHFAWLESAGSPFLCIFLTNSFIAFQPNKLQPHMTGSHKRRVVLVLSCANVSSNKGASDQLSANVAATAPVETTSRRTGRWVAQKSNKLRCILLYREVDCGIYLSNLLHYDGIWSGDLSYGAIFPTSEAGESLLEP